MPVTRPRRILVLALSLERTLFSAVDEANILLPQTSERTMDELLRYMRAMVMLQLHNAQAQSLGEDASPFRPELLLADAGFSAREISDMLAKTPAAVAKAITRGRSARRGKGDESASPSSLTEQLDA